MLLTFNSSSIHVSRRVDFTHVYFYYLITKPDAHKKKQAKEKLIDSLNKMKSLFSV